MRPFLVLEEEVTESVYRVFIIMFVIARVTWFAWNSLC